MSDLVLSTSPASPRRITAGDVTRPAAPARASATVWSSVMAAMIDALMAILNILFTTASLLNIESGIGTSNNNSY